MDSNSEKEKGQEDWENKEPFVYIWCNENLWACKTTKMSKPQIK